MGQQLPQKIRVRCELGNAKNNGAPNRKGFYREGREYTTLLMAHCVVAVRDAGPFRAVSRKTD